MPINEAQYGTIKLYDWLLNIAEKVRDYRYWNPIPK